MKHLDDDVLSALQEVMEDEYPVLLDTFLEDSSGRMGQLHQAANLDELRRAAHSFKGSSRNMGAQQLADLCDELERRAQQPSPVGIEDLINRIDTEYQLVHRLYSEERQRFPC